MLASPYENFADEDQPGVKNRQKVRPPFPALPAFTVSATILQFIGFEDEIQKLMNRLNRNTTQYFICHKHILRGFMDRWKPEIMTMLEFGNQDRQFDEIYPNPGELEKMPRYKRIKLEGIGFQ